MHLQTHDIHALETSFLVDRCPALNAASFENKYRLMLQFDVQLICYSITSDNSAPPDSLSRESMFESKSGSQPFDQI